MFWKRLMSSAVLVVFALIFLLTGGIWLGAVTTVLSMIAFRELMHACGVEENGGIGQLE